MIISLHVIVENYHKLQHSVSQYGLLHQLVLCCQAFLFAFFVTNMCACHASCSLGYALLIHDRTFGAASLRVLFVCVCVCVCVCGVVCVRACVVCVCVCVYSVCVIHECK